MRSLMLVGVVMGLAACGEEGTEGAKVAEACVQSDLIAQCPAGTAPQLDARAKTLCDGNADVDILDQNGAVSGRCQGEGSCTVLCNFPEACACGVESFTAAGVVCADCGALPAAVTTCARAWRRPPPAPPTAGPVCTPDRGAARATRGSAAPRAAGSWPPAGMASAARKADGATSCIDR
ncbi:MAG: hypothetical protein R3F43_13660 [bacterium]